MIEDPVEIIDNERELKGFYNLDDVIRLVGYFKSENSPRRLTILYFYMVKKINLKPHQSSVRPLSHRMMTHLRSAQLTNYKLER